MGRKLFQRSDPLGLAAPFKYPFARIDLPADLFIKNICTFFKSSPASEYCKETLLYSNSQSVCSKMLMLDAISSIKTNSIRCQLYFLLFMQLVFLFLILVVS